MSGQRDTALREVMKLLRRVNWAPVQDRDVDTQCDELIIVVDTLQDVEVHTREAAKIVAMCDMADLLYRRHDYQSAQRLLETALQRARDSGDSFFLSLVLGRLGHVAWMLDERIVAAARFQESLVYTDRQWPEALVNVLRLLGALWKVDDLTADRALAMFEWLLVINPRDLQAMVDRCECLMRLGRHADVQRDAKGEHTSCSGFAKAYAAMWALGQVKRARSVAKKGLEMAERSGDREWAEFFRSAMDR